MEIRIRATGAIMNDLEFRAANPRVSFPAVLTEAVLAGFGADPVLEGARPTAGRYQTVVRSGVEEVGGKWFKKYSVSELSAEARQQIDAAQAGAVRSTRDQKLAATDWTQLADSAADKTAYAAYRQALRDIPQQPGFPWDVTWPDEVK